MFINIKCSFCSFSCGFIMCTTELLSLLLEVWMIYLAVLAVNYYTVDNTFDSLSYCLMFYIELQNRFKMNALTAKGFPFRWMTSEGFTLSVTSFCMTNRWMTRLVKKVMHLVILFAYLWEFLQIHTPSIAISQRFVTTNSSHNDNNWMIGDAPNSITMTNSRQTNHR